MVDRREFELPAAGMIYVEDAETGEVIFVDTDDPGFQQRLRAAADERQAALVADLRSAGIDLFTVSTDEDLVRALFRIAQLRRRTAMSFAWPWMLLSLAAVPLVVLWYRRLLRARAARRAELAALGLVAPAAGSPGLAPAPAAGAAAGRAGAAADGAGPARGDGAAAPPRGHRDPRLRRVGQHGRDRPRRRPGSRRRRPPRAPSCERQPATVRVGVVAFGEQRAGHPGADRRPGERARGDRPAAARKAAPRSPAACRPR